MPLFPRELEALALGRVYPSVVDGTELDFSNCAKVEEIPRLCFYQLHATTELRLPPALTTVASESFGFVSAPSLDLVFPASLLLCSSVLTSLSCAVLFPACTVARIFGVRSQSKRSAALSSGLTTGAESDASPGAERYHNRAAVLLDFRPFCELRSVSTAMRYWQGAATVVFGSTLQWLRPYAFRELHVAVLDLSHCDTITELSGQCFDRARIGELRLPPNLTEIWHEAFLKATIDAPLCFPASLRHLHCGAFIQASVTKLDFSNCAELEEIPRLCFYKLRATTELRLPPALITVASESFGFVSAPSLDLVFPASLRAVDETAFSIATVRSVDLSACARLPAPDEDDVAVLGPLWQPTTPEGVFSPPPHWAAQL